MAKKTPTPAQVRDAKIAELNKKVKAGTITAGEYRKDVAMAKARYEAARRGGSRAAAGAMIQAADRANQGAKIINIASRLKAPAQALANIAKGGATPGQRAATLAATVVGPAVYSKAKSMKEANDKKTVRVPSSSVARSEKALGQRLGNRPAPKKPVMPSKRADSGDSARTPKPLTKAQQNAATGRLGASHTVKKGDTLWDIAQKNNTTVAALLKANPTIAKRKAAGKTTIFSGTKVRIPGKK